MHKSHKEIFFSFIDDLNNNQIKYILIRGFLKLPDSPDTDIDIVSHLNDYDKFHETADKHLAKSPDEPFQNYGFAEYCEMLYEPYFTPGKQDNNIPNGCFRVDTYNCFFFKSPYNNFQNFWTVPKKFNEYIFKKRVSVSKFEESYFIPSPECEITLLTLRDILDQQGIWKSKHKNRIRSLFDKTDHNELIHCLSLVFPFPYKIYEALESHQFSSIFNIIMDKHNYGNNNKRTC